MSKNRWIFKLQYLGLVTSLLHWGKNQAKWAITIYCFHFSLSNECSNWRLLCVNKIRTQKPKCIWNQEHFGVFVATTLIVSWLDSGWNNWAEVDERSGFWESLEKQLRPACTLKPSSIMIMMMLMLMMMMMMMLTMTMMLMMLMKHHADVHFDKKSVPWSSKCCRHIPLHWAPARSRSFWNSDCFNHYGIYGSRVSVLLSFGRWPVVLILALDLRLNHRDNSSERPFNRLPSPYLAII